MKKISGLVIIISIYIFGLVSVKANTVFNIDLYNLFDHNLSIMVIFDAETGQILHSNKAAADFYGYTIKDLKSMHIKKLSTLTDEELEYQIQAIMNETKTNFIDRHKLGNGDIRTVEIYSSPYSNKGNTVVFSIINDITEKTLLAQQKRRADTILMVVPSMALLVTIVFIILLLRSFRRLKAKNEEIISLNELRQTFVDADDSFIYLKDEKLNYIFINKAFQKFYSKSSSELIGKTDAQLTDNELIKVSKDADKDVIEKKTIIVDTVTWDNRIYQYHKFPVKLRDDNYGVGSYIEEITDDYNNKKDISKALKRNSILVDLMTRKYVSTEEQFDYVLNEIIKLTESQYGYIFLYSEIDKEFILQSWSKKVMKECEIINKLSRYQLEKMGLWGEVVRQRESIIINDFQKPNPLKKGYPKEHVPLKRFMTIPIFINGKIVAAVGLANKDEDYDQNDEYHVTALMHGVWKDKERREAHIELKKSQQEIVFLSYHDSLTGLYNRRFFEEELKRLDTQRNLPLSIIMGDVNGLKLANDIFGHNAGDTLLKTAGKVMKKSCRADDIIARWGGDEYIILLPNTTNEEAEGVAKRIRQSFANEKIYAIKGSISLGSGTKEFSNQNVYKAIEDAEEKMYLEKTLNSNNYNRNAMRDILRSLYKVIPGEKEHANRVSKLSEKIGRAMDLSEHEIKKLKYSALFHDIGLIAVDEGILKKESQFTDYELEKVRHHPVIGYRILNSSEDTMELAEYILSHQERWDGTGYPKGLKGEDIPLLSRIIGLAETYDMLITGFMCNKKLSRKEALLDIQKKSGTYFDPQIVDVLIGILNMPGPT